MCGRTSICWSLRCAYNTEFPASIVVRCGVKSWPWSWPYTASLPRVAVVRCGVLVPCGLVFADCPSNTEFPPNICCTMWVYGVSLGYVPCFGLALVWSPGWAYNTGFPLSIGCTMWGHFIGPGVCGVPSTPALPSNSRCTRWGIFPCFWISTSMAASRRV